MIIIFHIAFPIFLRMKSWLLKGALLFYCIIIISVAYNILKMTKISFIAIISVTVILWQAYPQTD